MTSTKTIQKLIDDGKTDVALDQINTRIKNKPTSDLHLLRIKLLSHQLDEIGILQTSLEWLTTHAPVSLIEAQTSLQDVIQKRLAQIPGLEHKSEEQPSADALTVVQELIPLADYFPVIHLTYGLILMHKAQGASSEKKSPLEILEEILAAAENERTPKSPFGRKRPRSEEKQTETYEKARHHLQQARRFLSTDDSRYSSTLEALGQVCEVLEDEIGAWKAYHEAQSYGCDFKAKLTALGKTVRETAHQRLLTHIDGLLKAGDLDKADSLLKAASMPDSEEVRVRLADLAFLRGDWKSAAEFYNRLVE